MLRRESDSATAASARSVRTGATDAPGYEASAGSSGMGMSLPAARPDETASLARGYIPHP